MRDVYDVFTAKLDSQGRLLIPASLRKQAGIEPDAEVLVFLEDGAVVLLTRQAALTQARQMVQRATAHKRSLVDELIANRRRDAEMEAQTVARKKKSA